MVQSDLESKRKPTTPMNANDESGVILGSLLIAVAASISSSIPVRLITPWLSRR
jgi:hypothetical protein